ncbi:hypothetical protein [Thalassomonas actiniarum]|uniref:Lipoprotein n=1 Tax=Thalassomonas actiniarum TaxID=485447 RepID=A0AAE9YUP4_9GAMM|nr:hypothetical protein [Thalassomonas actiniarum]WDE00907.1 hypothetical protein SG35_009905 [Thalassomonas actiniarum]
MRPIQVIFIVLLLFVTSCATKNIDSSLYEHFSNYALAVNNNNILAKSTHFFSERLLNQANSDSKNHSEVAEQLLYKQYMLRQFNNFEIIKDNTGCLTVNGYDNENLPLSFNLKYIQNKSNGLIDGINISFVNSASEFSTSAKCPDETS